MFSRISNWFGGSSNTKSKTSQKKKGLKDQNKEVKEYVNPINTVKMYGLYKQGFGPKKTECQDSFSIMEKFAGDCYFFAVYDGHGSSGKEASQAANDYI